MERGENEYGLREIWDTIKCTNICIMDVPEGEKREKQKKILKETMTKNNPN